MFLLPLPPVPAMTEAGTPYRRKGTRFRLIPKFRYYKKERDRKRDREKEERKQDLPNASIMFLLLNIPPGLCQLGCYILTIPLSNNKRRPFCSPSEELGNSPLQFG